MPPPMRLYALRGATTVTENDAAAILSATDELMHEILGRNALAPEDLVSCIFTLTEDLDAEFPAVAARRMGLAMVPLLHAREIPVPGSMPRVIRGLIHAYAPDGRSAQHVYLGEARKLRLALQGAQSGPRRGIRRAHPPHPRLSRRRRLRAARRRRPPGVQRV